VGYYLSAAGLLTLIALLRLRDWRTADRRSCANLQRHG
jgi:hypothetical protein